MRILDENTALAIVFTNIRRKKRSDDLVTIAKSFEYLMKLYGSQNAVAKKVGLSTEMIRQFLAVLKLPKEVQEMFSSRHIDYLDMAKELLALKEPQKQIIAARAFVHSLSEDARDIKRLVKTESVSVKDAKKMILEAKPKGLHIFLMDFDDEMYKAIVGYARTIKVKPAELVRKIVTDWFKHKKKMYNKRG